MTLFSIPAAKVMGLIAALMLALSGCLSDPNSRLRESPLQAEQLQKDLGSLAPPPLLEHWRTWYRDDWRLHLLEGVLAESSQAAREALLEAAERKPDEPIIHYHLALSLIPGWKDSGGAEMDLEQGQESNAHLIAALSHVRRARDLDPQNGILEILEAYYQVRSGEVQQARGLLADPRQIRSGDFYYRRLEEAILGLLHRSGRLTPIGVAEALELRTRVALPPFEPMVDVLYSVFLEPLKERPYDIRIRAREAATGIYNLGHSLRKASSSSSPLSSGFETRSLGYLFQLKSAEFMVLYHRAFSDASEARGVFLALLDMQADYEGFLAKTGEHPAPGVAFLSTWSKLASEKPALTLSEAFEEIRTTPFWKRILKVSLPPGDLPQRS